MSVLTWEKAKSIRGRIVNISTGSSGDRSFMVRGTDDPEIAHAAIASVAANSFSFGGGFPLIRQEIALDDLGNNTWEGKVRYGLEGDSKSQEPPTAGTWHFDFDTTGGTHKITVAHQQTKGQLSGSNLAPDLKGLIGWDGTKVEGTEIFVPKLEFSITAYYNADDVTMDFIRIYAQNTGKTNGVTWLGYSDAEVLFLGASGKGDIPLSYGQRIAPVAVTFKYAASETRRNFNVGDMTVPLKRGWDYLSVKYEKAEQSGVTFPTPVHWYVNEVYEGIDFGDLFFFG